MQRKPGQRFTLYDTAGIEGVLDRMAAEIAGRIVGRRVQMIGMLRRGAPLAAALHARLVGAHGLELAAPLAIKVRRYGDDLSLEHPETALQETVEQRSLDFAGGDVLIVDDVLYQGHSLWRTVGWALGKGAGRVEVAVLADRHARRLPVIADVVGIRVDVPDGWVVECNVPPYEEMLKIELCRLDAPGS
jgi:pyrimidine operon attenuation protein/uracil phosphoribosyltransferase